MVKVTQPPVGVWSLDAEDFIYCHDTSSIVENTMKVQTIKQKLSVILQLQLIFPPHAGMYMCMLERKGRERQIGGGGGETATQTNRIQDSIPPTPTTDSQVRALSAMALSHFPPSPAFIWPTPLTP